MYHHPGVVINRLHSELMGGKTPELHPNIRLEEGFNTLFTVFRVFVDRSLPRDRVNIYAVAGIGGKIIHGSGHNSPTNTSTIPF